MIKFGRFSALLIAAAMLCGCTAIPSKPQSAPESAEATEETEEAPYDEVVPQRYSNENVDVLLRLNAEGGVFEGNIRTDGMMYDGSGYIVLDEEMSLTHIISVPASQHYRVVLAAQSYTGAAVRVKIPGESVGVLYIEPTDSTEFTLYGLDNIYLEHGEWLTVFEVLSGTVSMDYILVEDSSAVSSTAYSVSASPVVSGSAIASIGLMNYFSDIYGQYTLTAQNVTPGTNAELDCIFRETGRYPAIRCGDVIYSSPAVAEEYAEKAAEELRLAQEWGENGGISSLMWHWYSPSEGKSSIYSTETDFDLSDAVTEYEVALADIEEVKGLCEGGLVNEATYRLISDLDAMAEALKPLCEAGVPILWQPIPDGESSLYWWGGDSEEYKWLWRLMFSRFSSFHDLNNLIWVWNGSSKDFYPGDSVCDIVGQSFAEGSTASFAARFGALSRISDTDTKAVAVTSTDRIMNPSYMMRDNALWLWTALGSGESIINSDGTLSETNNSWQTLHNTFNNRVTLTLDELPDFHEYSLVE